MSARTPRLALLTALVLAATTACASSGGSSGGQDAQLTLWVRGANERINTTLVKAYNSSHQTTVKMLAIPDAEYTQKLAAATQAGTPPDVVDLDVVSVPELARSGALTDIRSRVDALSFKDDLVKSYLDYSTYRHGLYAVPENVDASALFWNKDLFSRAGLDPDEPPTTYAELKADAAAITALGGDTKGFYLTGQCSGCTNYAFSPFVWASGGDFVSADGKRSTLTDPGVVAGLQLYQDLWKAGDVPASAQSDTGADWVSAFGAGNTGMVGLGAFAIAQLTHDYPAVHFGVAPFPGEDGGQSSFTGGDVMAIPARSTHSAAAWKFIEWTLSPAAQVEVHAKDGGLVARSDLVDNPYSTDPNVIAEDHALQLGRLPVYYPNAAQIDAPTGPYAKAFQDVVFGGADPTTRLATAQKEFQALLDRG
jgi:multiple sugar transport system substrate-binding protein